MSPLDWLFGLEQFGVKFGLATITTLVDALDRPERAFRAVHIAGTNGKGSVAAMVDAGLRAAGHRAGRYTSPHLCHLVERFAIDGVPVAEATLIESADRLRQLAERLRAQGRLETSPTFFEATTALAFDLFRQSGVAVGVVEVGLGGRLDATNILRPAVTAITTIGLDHQQHLGHSLAEIAREKAGIIKPGAPVVIGRLPPAAAAVVHDTARQRGAPLIDAWDGVSLEGVNPRGDSTTIARFTTPRRRYTKVALRLAGAHQVDNAVVAVRVLEALAAAGIAVPAAAVAAGLASVSWPGRLDRRRLGSGREALLDAAHNPDGASALATFLANDSMKRPLVFAVMRDKDAQSMIRALAPHLSAVIVTRASNPRSAEIADLVAAVRTAAPCVPVRVEASPAAALAAAWQLSPRIVVAGSIFLLGDVMSELERS